MADKEIQQFQWLTEKSKKILMALRELALFFFVGTRDALPKSAHRHWALSSLLLPASS